MKRLINKLFFRWPARKKYAAVLSGITVFLVSVIYTLWYRCLHDIGGIIPTPFTVYWLGALALVLLGGGPRYFRCWILSGFLGAGIALAGCMSPQVSSPAAYHEFENAGAAFSVVDTDQLVRARTEPGPYRVTRGDLLEFHLPKVLGASSGGADGEGSPREAYPCRVSDAFHILLPVVGELDVTGRTLPEIENAIEEAFYPRYAVCRPEVVGTVKEYHTENITVTGAVRQPGVYLCRHDEMTLVNALMKAGGIAEKGAGIIRIRREGDTDQSSPLALPVKGLNLDFADVLLRGGDIIEVEPLASRVFTVVGLVRKPGVFAFEPHMTYNAMQGLACAGGVNEIADPRYVRIYRQKPDGQLVDATFKIDGSGLNSLACVMLKPGDVVSVEQTIATRTRLLFAEVFRIAAGVDVRTGYQ